ncbi:MAG: hypothetical protein ACI3Y5_06030 [Prevotella sp.]
MAIKAVKPYIHPESINFKLSPYMAWERLGGQTARSMFPPHLLHGLAYRCEMPTLYRKAGEARLMFIEPVSITFDTFPYYATHEIIPFIWDCWPRYYDKMERWMRRHNTHTAIFTSREEMEAMQKRLPEVRMFHCPEAVDSSLYIKGKELNERPIDLLEFGRSNEKVLGTNSIDGIRHVCTRQNGRFIYTNDELFHAMADAKATICLPCSITHPDTAEGVETMTQRYWEAMLSRMVIIGHCPKELEDILGYNPVIEIDTAHPAEQIRSIIKNITSYQELVDKNHETALRLGDWTVRIRQLMTALEAI